jgi:hypothetical protein
MADFVVVCAFDKAPKGDRPLHFNTPLHCDVPDGEHERLLPIKATGSSRPKGDGGGFLGE